MCSKIQSEDNYGYPLIRGLSVIIIIYMYIHV